ncbi:MAG: hypothetical protein V5A77_02530 [Candidatus Bipolaricaulota bacterium]
MNRIDDFKEREEKENGENISGTVSIYPQERLSWSNSGYLNEDEEGEKFMELYGKLIYQGRGASGKEDYLLKTVLGNFRLVKKDRNKLQVRKFLPSNSSRMVHKSDL